MGASSSTDLELWYLWPTILCTIIYAFAAAAATTTAAAALFSLFVCPVGWSVVENHMSDHRECECRCKFAGRRGCQGSLKCMPRRVGRRNGSSLLARNAKKRKRETIESIVRVINDNPLYINFYRTQSRAKSTVATLYGSAVRTKSWVGRLKMGKSLK